MRSVLRVLAGVVLVAGGVLALAGGVVAWTLGERRMATAAGDDGAFVANLAPVRTDGYTIVVPDVATVLARHGMARYLGDGQLTITVRSAEAGSDGMIVVALVSAGDALRYLSGTARSEVLAVGFTTGEQPVEVAELAGGAPAGTAPWESAEVPPDRAVQAGRIVTVSLDVPSEEAVALVVRRLDGSADLGVTMTVGFAPASWGTATTVLLIAGGLGTVAGLALLVLRRPWIDPDDPIVVGFEPEQSPAAVPSPAALVRRRMWRTDPEPEPRWPTNPAPAAADESPYVHTAT